jgi:hypothetical protein
MPQTFIFEELDETTRNYLTAVRDAGGSGAPGVFSTTASSMAGCGCIAGAVVIVATFLLTLTTWIDVIYDDPVRVALLQTAGLVLGGWLLIAAMRSSGKKVGSKTAGHWVYVDPLHLYEAYREQVTVTRVDDAVEANFTHNYNNGSYQNSVVKVLLGGNSVAQVTLNNEQRAEQMVVYLNYLAWARGEGGDRATLPPASLGGLAKYVAKNDAEPKDAEGNINLNLVELDITQVPEEPTREGRAAPSVLPYIFILVAAAAIFGLMAYVVNPPIRDEAIYDAVTRVTQPPSVEPRFLRAYLIDPRNTRHRDEVQRQLAGFYDPAISHVTNRATDAELRGGMVQVLESLRTADQPIVSLKVTEKPDGKPGAAERQKKILEGIVGGNVAGGTGGIMDEFAKVSPPIQPGPGVVFKEQPPPIGHQLIAFVEAPEGANNAHFEITYTLKPGINQNSYRVEILVEIRTTVEAPPVATSTLSLPGEYSLSQLESNDAIRNAVVQATVGRVGAN